MKKRLLAVLSVILTFLMMGSTFSFAANVAPVSVDKFTDVAADSWYYDYVKYVANPDGPKIPKAPTFAYMNGTSESTFEPQSNLTRAMFATILARYHRVTVDDSKATIFTDVPVDQWYTGSIGWNNENGIVEGYGDNIFGTNDFITREQLATMIVRYIPVFERDYPKYRIQTNKPLINFEFVDADDISGWAKDAIAKCVDYGLLEGYPDKTVKPKQNITRAEAAAIIYRLSWLVKSTGGGSSGSSVRYEYTVGGTVQAGDRVYELTPVTYSEYDAKNNIAAEDVAKDLVAANSDIKTTISSVLESLSGKANTVSVDGYTITTTDENEIIVDGVDLGQKLQDEIATYEDKMDSVKEKAGIQSDKWDDFVDAFSPGVLFTTLDEETLTLKDADGYYEALVNAVNAACDLYTDIRDNEDIESILEAAEDAGGISGLNVLFNTNGAEYYIDDGTKVTSPSDITDATNTRIADLLSTKAGILPKLKDGKTWEYVAFEATECPASPEDVTSIIDDRTSVDLSDNDGIMAIIKAVEKAYVGKTFNVKITVTKSIVQ